MTEETYPHIHLLWLTENYPSDRGGMAQACDRIVHALRCAGIFIDLVYLNKRLAAARIDTRSNGIDIGFPAGSDIPHSLNCLWNLLSNLSEKRVYTHLAAFGGHLPLIAGPVYSAWLEVPLVTLLRGNDFDAALFHPGRREILKDALQRSARVTVVSQEKARKITQLFPDIHPVWIPNGIDLACWNLLPSHLQKADSWRRQQVKSGARVLGLFGQIKQKKGGLFFLQTLLESGMAAQFHLLIAGDVEEEAMDWLKIHDAEISCSYQPFMDRYDLLSWYPACDFVVIPSLYDGLPNVLLEAAALGIPLLASTAGGMADHLVDGKHGFLFRSGDPHECRLALDRAAALPMGELRKQGEECRSLIQTSLRLDQETARYLSLLEEVGQSRRTNCTIPVCARDLPAR
jgi:glycogen synthase